MIKNTSPMDRRIVGSRIPRIATLAAVIVAAAVLAFVVLLPVAHRWWRADRAVDATTIRTAT